MTRLSSAVGPDAPIETKPNGARQSASPYRADLLPAHACLVVAAILKGGAEKYGENNWHGLTVDDCINHAMVHIFAHNAGDRSDDHIGHAACRMLMALELAQTACAAQGEEPTKIKEPEENKTPCCGYTWHEPSLCPIYWNPYSRVVQCHNCGRTFPLAPSAD